MAHDFTRCGALVGLLLLVGCGGQNTVTGTVTYDGAPIQNGTITFSPADGQGPSAGGTIKTGQFEVSNITIGEKKVFIKAFDQVSVVTSTEELASAAESGQRAASAKPGKLVPDNAQGNGQIVNIAAGSQILDFPLMPPSSD